MSSSRRHETINYIELPAKDLSGTKTFFTNTFGWAFEDFGPGYTAFYSATAGLDGGFYQSEMSCTTAGGSSLVVLYSADLEATLKKVVDGGGSVLKPVFDFPGGRRFHFADPSGNEYAVWSEQKQASEPEAQGAA